jgi:hypothetical protein
MRNRFVSAFVAASALLWPAMAEAQQRDHPDRWSGNLFGFLGSKQLDEEGWGSLDRHDEGAFLFDVSPPNWPFNFVLQSRSTGDEDMEGLVEVEAGTWELNLGVRWYLGLDPQGAFQVFIGGGFTYGFAVMERFRHDEDESDSDYGTGYWADVGAIYIWPGGFSLGVNVAFSDWDAEGVLGGEDVKVEAGGWHAGVIIGFHW